MFNRLPLKLSSLITVVTVIVRFSNYIEMEDQSCLLLDCDATPTFGPDMVNSN